MPPRRKALSDRERVFLGALRRVSEIHRLIASGTFPNVRQLAERLGVSARTVKRDLQVMRDSLGAPIYHDRRKRGFTYSKPGWLLPLSRLREGDLLAFFIAENALRLTGQSAEALKLKSSLAKIAALLPDEVSINLATLGENVSFQNAPFAVADPQTLNLVASAAVAQHSIEFDYYSPHRQAKSHRIADVHLMHNFAGDWFAISYDHQSGEFRDFHVGRMSNVRETNRTFTRQKGWHADDYLQTGFTMMRGGRLITVKILFDAYQSQWIKERKFFHPNEEREELPDGSMRLSFKVGENGLEAVARFCLTYAGHCVAERPKQLREIIRDKLRKALELNR